MRRLHGNEAPRVWKFLAIVVWSLWGVSCEGCDGCRSTPPLATLQGMQGDDVARDFAAAQRDWKAAQVGAEFQLEDGLKTGDDSQAVLGLFNGSVMTVQPATQIRFRTAQAPGQQAIDVSTGEAVLRTGARAMTLETLMGTAVLQSQSQVRLMAGDEGAVRYAVEVGSAVFRSADGETVEVEAGQEYEVGIGEAVFLIEPPELEPAPEPEPEAEEEEGDATAEEPEEEGDELDKELGQPSLKVGTVDLKGGRSLIIHAPTVPTTINIGTVGVCPDTAVVQLTRPVERYYGKGRVAFEMGAGSRSYMVRCVDENGIVERRARARGRVRVLRDHGKHRLPKRAPSTRVEADGRSYHVLYQNQLPNVTVAWPRAPEASSYTVEVDGKTRTSSKPELLFKSGELGDGTHKVSFAAAGRKSRQATIVVTFDNAAPKAALSSPEDGSFAVGDTVNVTGVALPGWNVTADHGTIDLDSSNRFSGQVTTSPEHPDVVLRLTHPSRGTHVYIRRSQRSP